MWGQGLIWPDNLLEGGATSLILLHFFTHKQKMLIDQFIVFHVCECLREPVSKKKHNKCIFSFINLFINKINKYTMYDIAYTSWIFVAENLANHIRLPPPLLCKQCGGLSYWLAIKWSWKEMERCSCSGQKWKILCFLHSFRLRLDSWKGLFFFCCFAHEWCYVLRDACDCVLSFRWVLFLFFFLFSVDPIK